MKYFFLSKLSILAVGFLELTSYSQCLLRVYDALQMRPMENLHIYLYIYN